MSIEQNNVTVMPWADHRTHFAVADGSIVCLILPSSLFSNVTSNVCRVDTFFISRTKRHVFASSTSDSASSSTLSTARACPTLVMLRLRLCLLSLYGRLFASRRMRIPWHCTDGCTAIEMGTLSCRVWKTE